MIVTEDTKYADFAPLIPYISDDTKKELEEAAQKLYGYCNTLTLDEFFGLLDGDYQKLGDISNPTVLQAFWMQRFSEFCGEFANMCEQLTMQLTIDQQKASQGTKPLDYRASVLVFVRDYFNKHSFVDCGDITLGEYITARQDKFNTQVVQRNYQRIQEQKFKKNKR